MKQIIYIFSVLFILLSVICAVPISPEDAARLSALFLKAGINETYTAETFCGYARELTCFVGTPYNTIGWIGFFKGNSTIELVASDFSGYSKLEKVFLVGYKVQNQFLKEMNTLNPNISTIQVQKGGITDLPTGLTQTVLNLDDNPLNPNQYFSRIAGLYRFEYTQGNENIIWNNDLNENSIIRITNVELFTSTFPNFSYFPDRTSITIHVTSNFSDMSNMEKMSNNVDELKFKNNNKYLKVLEFPPYLASFTNSDTLFHRWDFYSEYINWTISSPLDFSKGNIRELDIRYGSFKSPNGFPISKVNNQMQLTITDTDLNIADFNVLRKLENVDLSNNQIDMQVNDLTDFLDTDKLIIPSQVVEYYVPRRYQALDIQKNKFRGTVPKFFCNTWVNFNTNNFTGVLPSCYTCYLNDSKITSLVKGNQFSNYQDTMTPSQYPPCTTIKINSYVVANASSVIYRTFKYVFYIIGEDFGVESNIVLQVPSLGNLTFEPYKYNELYGVSLNETVADIIKSSSSVTVTFVAPNISFNLDVTKSFNNILAEDSPVVRPFPADPSTPKPTNTPSTTSDGSTTGTTPDPTSTTGSTTTSGSTTSPETPEPNTSSKLTILSSLFSLIMLAIFLLI